MVSQETFNLYSIFKKGSVNICFEIPNVLFMELLKCFGFIVVAELTKQIHQDLMLRVEQGITNYGKFLIIHGNCYFNIHC